MKRYVFSFLFFLLLSLSAFSQNLSSQSAYAQQLEDIQYYSDSVFSSTSLSIDKLVFKYNLAGYVTVQVNGSFYLKNLSSDTFINPHVTPRGPITGQVRNAKTLLPNDSLKVQFTSYTGYGSFTKDGEIRSTQDLICFPKTISVIKNSIDFFESLLSARYSFYVNNKNTGEREKHLAAVLFKNIWLNKVKQIEIKLEGFSFSDNRFFTPKELKLSELSITENPISYDSLFTNGSSITKVVVSIYVQNNCEVDIELDNYFFGLKGMNEIHFFNKNRVKSGDSTLVKITLIDPFKCHLKNLELKLNNPKTFKELSSNQLESLFDPLYFGLREITIEYKKCDRSRNESEFKKDVISRVIFKEEFISIKDFKHLDFK